MHPTARALAFWPLFAGTVATDVVTKWIVEDRMYAHTPRHDSPQAAALALVAAGALGNLIDGRPAARARPLASPRAPELVRSTGRR